MNDDRAHGPIDKLFTRRVGPEYCFFCAQPIHAKTSTEEHVIPRWVQQRFNLWNKRLTLLNGTTINYKHLTVPCCIDCNTQRLQPIESKLSAATLVGSAAVRDIGRESLFVWLGKIVYGLLYKQTQLPAKRALADSPPIMSARGILDFQKDIYFLQFARGEVRFPNGLPASIFVFETQAGDHPDLQWDYCDSIPTLVVGVKVGKVGIVAVLRDGGAQQVCEKEYMELSPHPLHPLQFRELFAQIVYRSRLYNRVPKYMIVLEPCHVVIRIPDGTGGPIFDQAHAEDYAKILSEYTGIPLNDLFRPPDGVHTWLRDAAGIPVYLPLREYRFLPRRLRPKVGS
ncbi:MAG: hypothetical protein HZA90_13410 [Verrucomicrobia bacterium]|nr:hypothetical protein [Verrucomicrobiota bacterium]